MAEPVTSPSPLIDEIRARIARFSREDFREQDLTTTFLFLRSNARGLESMRAVGDLLAHQGRLDRQNNHILAEVQRFCDNVANHIHFSQAKQSPKPPPERFLKGLEASLHRAFDKPMKKAIGIPKARAAKMLPGLIQRLADAEGGTIDTTPEENKLLLYLHSTFTTKARFTDKDLIRDFENLLRLEGIAKLKLTTNCRRFLCLYVLSKMHNTVVEVRGHPSPYLVVNDSWGTGLSCSMVAPLAGMESVSIATELFSTSLKMDEFVEPGALQTDEGVSKAIEVGTDLKLHAIV